MIRIIAGIVCGLVAWFIVATIGNLVIRLSWPDYVAVETSMAFTLPMMLARLLVGAVASLAAGTLVGWIARGSGKAIMGVGILLTLLFIPIHYNLWDKFPLWYHAAFLISIFPLTLAGAYLSASANRAAPIA
ncbi:MAG TPA: hypothetical protein VLQ46_04075 [Casimicrobiaceae bacterium]|nr:hypothetical protein [Casimicrobiaceae bacterium]